VVDRFGKEAVDIDDTSQKFTGKERDAETGLDFFGARYMSAAQGRFTSPDPVYFQKEMLTDPQRFNLYAYTRNNPLRFIDPFGESIELLGDEEKRKKELQALQNTVGSQAGSYLYENAVTTKDANGNETTRYYVGVYTNGPDGNGPSFDKINSVAGEIAPIIADTKNIQLNVVSAGTKVTDDFGGTANINARTPAATGIFGGNLRVNLLDPSTPILPLDSFFMSNGQLGPNDAGTVLGHELGHGRGTMSGVFPASLTNSDALRLENKVRQLKHPEGGQRLIHDCPPGACSGTPK
jgi:RHS repeat-associated protein